ncbi:hypothetical protein L9F63_006962, partial [Diploptera punctata]
RYETFRELRIFISKTSTPSSTICLLAVEAPDTPKSLRNSLRLSPVFRTVKALYKIVVQLIHDFGCEKELIALSYDEASVTAQHLNVKNFD